MSADQDPTANRTKAISPSQDPHKTGEAEGVAPINEPLPQEIADEAEAETLPSFHDLGLGERTANALEAMTYEGITLDLAAARYGLYKQNLTRAFNRPRVRAVYNQAVKMLREGGAIQAYTRITRLSQTSASDHVKLDANKWIAGVGNIAPIKRVEGRFQHNHSFEGFDYGDPVDITPDGDDS